MLRARTDETLKFFNLNFPFLATNGEKKLVFLLWFLHAYLYKIVVYALASVILNLKLFEFFVLDGPSPRFHQ